MIKKHLFIGIIALLGIAEKCFAQIATPAITTKSVVHIVTDEGTCNGVLLNNASENGNLYILSAGHCIASSNQFLSVVFGRDLIIENSNLKSVTWQSSALEELQLSRDLDYVLLQLNEAVPAHITPYYAGWDARAAIPVSSYGIHSPESNKIFIEDLNRPKKATFEGITDFGGIPVTNGTFNIARWEQGYTTTGSSGSPLFNNYSRLTGILSGGASSALNPTNDFYTRFDLIFNNGVKNWLDPDSQTDLFIDGIDLGLESNDVFKKSNFSKSDSLTASTNNQKVSENFSGSNPSSIKGVYITVNEVIPTDLISLSITSGESVLHEQFIFSGLLNAFSENFIQLTDEVAVGTDYSINITHNQSVDFPLTNSENSTVSIGGNLLDNRSLLISTLNEGIMEITVEDTEIIRPVYPNPSTQNFYLEGSEIDEITNIEIFTSKGDEIPVITFKDYKNRILIDMSYQQKGLYYLQYQLKNEVVLSKLLLR